MIEKKFDIRNSNKIKNFNQKIEVDSDKSLSIRSLLFSAISENISEIDNLLVSEDVKTTLRCLKSLGVVFKKKGARYYIYGKGLGSFTASKNAKLDFGNSGTLARLMIGILSSTPNIDVKLIGDSSLNKRNMSGVIDLMKKFGANFSPSGKVHFPLNMCSSEIPIGIKYIAGKSAQLKSSVILAGLNSFGNTTVIERLKSRDHTERLLKKNKSIQIKKYKKENVIRVIGKRALQPYKIKISGDPSSAAFFCALTLLLNKSKLLITNVGLNPTRTGFYSLLKKFGAKINFKNIKNINSEKKGDIEIKSSKLKPIFASEKFYMNSTDEYPILFVIAALTKGKSTFRGIEELKNKESNRVFEMQRILKQIGIKTKYKSGSLVIFGKNIFKHNAKILVPNLGDHRICMSALILSLVTGIQVNIKNFETVKTSFPSFLKIIKKLGGKFAVKEK